MLKVIEIMSSSEGQTSKKRKVSSEEDESAFEDPCIEYGRINRRIWEDTAKAQIEEMKAQREERLKLNKPMPYMSSSESGKQLLEELLKEPSSGRAPRISGRAPIEDFGPSYIYYGVVQSCARMAITSYNKLLKTIGYKLVKIDNVARTRVCGVIFDITFQAQRPGRLATFESHVHVSRDSTKVISVRKTAKQNLDMALAKKKIKISDEAALTLKQCISRRVDRGKQELRPEDAAVMIQKSFRAYRMRRSHAIRALRELAIAKTKLKELKELFDDRIYRRRVACDVEERQRFTEKILALLLTVKAVEVVNLMVKSARKSMIGKLGTMIDVVDPQPAS